MSIYNAIANHGRDVGAGLNAFAQGRYRVAQDQRANALEDENRAYTKSRNALADQRYSQEQKAALEAKADQHFRETLDLMAKATDPATVFRDRQRQAISMNISGAREATLEQAMGYMPKPVDPEAKFKEWRRKTDYEAGIAADRDFENSRRTAQLDALRHERSLEAAAAADERKRREAEAKARPTPLDAAEAESEAVTFKDMITDANFADAVGPWDNIASGFFGLFDTQDYRKNKQVTLAANELILSAASNLKGALSDKDIKFLQDSQPKPSDHESVWKDWFDKRYLPRINAARKSIDLPPIDPINSSASNIDRLIDKYGR